ncbi:MAG: carbon starvation CstA family protein, partial [Bacillota bacterium]|nr:carbon starvation CstA family protein [Bacillota bacterium]
MKALRSILLWGVISALGAAGFAVMALKSGETINAIWLLTAAVCTYAVGYRFYSKFIAQKVFQLDDTRKTPAEIHNDGKDYVPTNRVVLFGHH